MNKRALCEVMLITETARQMWACLPGDAEVFFYVPQLPPAVTHDFPEFTGQVPVLELDCGVYLEQPKFEGLFRFLLAGYDLNLSIETHQVDHSGDDKIVASNAVLCCRVWRDPLRLN